MVAINEQIVTAFEDLKMTPEEIAEDQGLDLSVVKAVLIQCCTEYRKSLKQEKGPETEFTDEDLVQVNTVIRNTALYSDDPHLQFRAATYIRDDKKGRKEIIKQIQQGPQINALTFNIQMQKANKALQRALGLVVEVEEVAQ